MSSLLVKTKIILINIFPISIIIFICSCLCHHFSASYLPNHQDGQQLLVRPHWAKELPRKAAGLGINDYMRKVSYSIHVLCTVLKLYSTGLQQLYC